jgi:ubiquinone/menaquinone biosynthesis C-methylase UbiE
VLGPRRAFFDQWSRIYDHPLLQRATYRPVHDAVLRTLAATRADAILDLGCGTGQLLRRMDEELPARHLVGLDFSRGMLARAGERVRTRRPMLVRGDALRLPFSTASFAAVVSTEAFHWFPDHDAALAEIFRVLAPGGTLLLGFVNPPFAFVGDLAALGSRLLGEPLYWPTAAALRRRVERAGFTVVAQRRIFRVPGFLLPPVLTEARRR